MRTPKNGSIASLIFTQTNAQNSASNTDGTISGSFESVIAANSSSSSVDSFENSEASQSANASVGSITDWKAKAGTSGGTETEWKANCDTVYQCAVSGVRGALCSITTQQSDVTVKGIGSNHNINAGATSTLKSISQKLRRFQLAQLLAITVQLKLALVLPSLLAHSLLRVHLIPLLPLFRLSKENLVFNLLGSLIRLPFLCLLSFTSLNLPVDLLLGKPLLG